jgi:dephospho-CoA kinase
MPKYTIITGPSGTGKGTITSYLRDQYETLIFQPSQITRQILEEFEIPTTRIHYSHMMELLRELFGNDIYIRAAEQFIHKHPDRDIVFDGIRKVKFAEYLISHYDADLWYIDTPPELRYERIHMR